MKIEDNHAVVMSFRECGGDVGDDVLIPLSHWVTEIGQKNPDIYILLIKKGNATLNVSLGELTKSGF
ncbi:hypothetical protein ACFX19_030905 [Malus domestica]